MKGKSTFTQLEIAELFQLIERRQYAGRSEQKRLRDRMRAIGFYGGDDWGIYDCKAADLDDLIRSGQIEIIP